MRILFVILLITASQVSFACDVCGCQMGGFTLGISPQKSSNYVGVNYNYAAFSAEIINNSIYFPDEFSDDSYQSIDVQAKINLNEKLSVFGMLPYGYNIMDGNLQNARGQGLKDVVFAGFYELVDINPNSGMDSTTRNWQHLLNIGMGGKAPTGEFQLMDTQTQSLINPNFQLGSGSWDALTMLNYKVKYKKVGLAAEQVFKYNFANAQDYRFGNQYNLSMNAFTWWFEKGFSFLPYGGAYFEWAGIHRDFEGYVANTGGNALFGDLGAMMIYNNWGISLDAKVPLMQNFNTDHHVHIQGGWRWQVSLKYYFERVKEN